VIQQHKNLFDHEEYNKLYEGLCNMEEALQEAALQSQDPPLPDQPTLYRKIYTGKPGRPRHEIDPELLHSVIHEHHHGPTSLDPIVECSTRMVWRCALENGIVEPGPPVYVEFEAPETGVKMRWYSSTAPGPGMSVISDQELDKLVGGILEVFPFFGREMIDGQLHFQGH
jgi:hypothetical protein